MGGYNSTYSVLEFNSYVTPNTVKIFGHYDTSEGNTKAWLSRHPVNPNIILGSNDHAVANKPGHLTSYSLDPITGKLTYIDSVDTGGFPSATFRFDPLTGKFGEQINKEILEFPGYTLKPRQRGKAGEDLIRMYDIDENGILTEHAKYQMPYAAGLRHVAITADGKTMYILFELSVMLRAMSIDRETGELIQINEDVPIYDTTTTSYSENITAAALYVSNDGRFVYALNRVLTELHLRPETIAVWSVSPKDGSLKRIQSAPVPGAYQTRCFKLSPPVTTGSAGGQYVVADGVSTDNTSVFKRDRATGLLELVASVEGSDQLSTDLWL
ncbi:Lactonase, 7-bladed beta-propeller-domain-containing protein [Xylariaceae sp. FL0255]|nr:Lactonase, 7-bladed beta-propeller-domain-containing protein [Xylariaceae sp. FL0255]